MVATRSAFSTQVIAVRVASIEGMAILFAGDRKKKD